MEERKQNGRHGMFNLPASISSIVSANGLISFLKGIETEEN